MGEQINILDFVPVREAKYCKRLMKDLGVKVDYEEVLLSKKGLVDFCSMSHMVCLEVLWLNDNSITKIRGLDTNVQLKCLYLHNNKINTLQGSLKYLKHLITLTLNNNRLQDLQATLPLIKHITRLEELDLSGNPLANEVNYRLRVIHTFPKLKVLDKHEVTVDERTEAKVLFEEIKVSNVAFTKTKPDWKNPPAQEMACLSIMTKDMYKEIEKFKAQKERERKQAEMETSMAMSGPRTLVVTKGVPLATGVEMMNSKRLKDVLGDAWGENQKSQRRVHGDYFTMKRFVRDVAPKVSLEETLALSSRASSVAASRSASLANNARLSSVALAAGDDRLILDQERYTMYEEIRKKPPIQSMLADYVFYVKVAVKAT